jgi:sulfur carrier protein ThiS
LPAKGTPKDFIAKLNAVAVETVAADLEFDIVPRERQTPEGGSAPW